MNNVNKSIRTALLLGVACMATQSAVAQSIEDDGALSVPSYIVDGAIPPTKSPAVPSAPQPMKVQEEASEVALEEDEQNAAETVVASQAAAEEASAQSDEGVELDSVASASLEEEIREYEHSRGTGQRTGAESDKPCADPTKICRLQVNAGELEMLRLSSLHMNRLITPFSSPEIITTDLANFSHDVRGSSIYFQPNENTRSVLFIREKGLEDPVIQLGITGENVIPRQIALEFSEDTHFLPHGSGKSTDGTGMQMTAASIMQQVRSEFTTVAQMGIPDGFTLVSRTAALPEFCMNHNGARFSFAGGQKLSGADYDIYVGIVSNQTASEIHLDETWCSTESVMAVAFWEDVLLLPGHESEVYVAARQQSQSTYNERKSLIKGAR